MKNHLSWCWLTDTVVGSANVCTTFVTIHTFDQQNGRRQFFLTYTDRTDRKEQERRELKTHVILVPAMLLLHWVIRYWNWLSSHKSSILIASEREITLETTIRWEFIVVINVFITEITENWCDLFDWELTWNGMIFAMHEWCTIRRGRWKYDVYSHDCRRCCHYYYGNRIILDYLNMADYSCH